MTRERKRCALARRSVAAITAAAACLWLLNAPAGADQPTTSACKLLTQAEVETALGIKLSPFAPSGSFCGAKSDSVSVMLRLAKSSGTQGDAKKSLEMMKQMGMQVDVKTFGPITCSTLVPPAKMTQSGYNTTCSVTKPGSVAAIEVATKSQQSMVPIDKLRPLAEKMSPRF